MRKLLKQNGRIIMEVPNIEATYHAPNKIFHVGHLYWYNPNTIQALALQYGFIVDDIQIINGTEHINLILTKSNQQNDIDEQINTLLTGNAQHVSEALQAHNMLKHYLSTTPYVRFFKKMYQYYKEQKYIKSFNDGKDVCDSACNNWLTDSNKTSI